MACWLVALSSRSRDGHPTSATVGYSIVLSPGTELGLLCLTQHLELRLTGVDSAPDLFDQFESVLARRIKVGK